MNIAFLPPVIQIYIKEGFLDIDSLSEFKRRFSDNGFIADLCSQADWSFREFSYIDNQENKFYGDFVLTPSLSLSPFFPAGKCFSQNCYDGFINKFAKTIALYADKAILKDTFTAAIHNLSQGEEKTFSDNYLVSFHNQMRAFKKLFPLIEKGIISFANPSSLYCE